jgi:hypothetical protein
MGTHMHTIGSCNACKHAAVDSRLEPCTSCTSQPSNWCDNRKENPLPPPVPVEEPAKEPSDLHAELELARKDIATLQDNVRAMQPVVEAAIAWRHDDDTAASARNLAFAVAVYDATKAGRPAPMSNHMHGVLLGLIPTPRAEPAVSESNQATIDTLESVRAGIEGVRQLLDEELRSDRCMVTSMHVRTKERLWIVAHYLRCLEVVALRRVNAVKTVGAPDVYPDGRTVQHVGEYK